MRIAVISDTHGRLNWDIPSCDVFIHVGDITGGGSLQETAVFANKLRERMDSPEGPEHAIIVPGNHDECFELFPEPTLALFGPCVHVLLHESLVLDGVLFFGSPWTPPFMQWHFMAPEQRLAAMYEAMPAEVDVLATHGPPYGVLDPGWQAAHVGSTALASAISVRNVQHHVFGHLHAAGGRMLQQEHTTFYNVAACNDAYVLVNQPRVFDVQRVSD